MRKCIPFIDWDSVGYTISRVHDNTCCAARSVERQHSLDGDIHRGSIEGLEHDLSHSLAIGLWVQWCLSEEDRVLLWCNAELIVEGVVPNLLHIVPIGDNAV